MLKLKKLCVVLDYLNVQISYWTEGFIGECISAQQLLA